MNTNNVGNSRRIALRDINDIFARYGRSLDVAGNPDYSPEHQVVGFLIGRKPFLQEEDLGRPGVGATSHKDETSARQREQQEFARYRTNAEEVGGILQSELNAYFTGGPSQKLAEAFNGIISYIDNTGLTLSVITATPDLS